VEHDAMTDRDAVAEDRRPAVVADVDHRKVLDVRSSTDAHALDVAADHALEPDARLGADLDVADHVRGLVHPDIRSETGLAILDSNDHLEARSSAAECRPQSIVHTQHMVVGRTVLPNP